MLRKSHKPILALELDAQVLELLDISPQLVFLGLELVLGLGKLFGIEVVGGPPAIA